MKSHQRKQFEYKIDISTADKDGFNQLHLKALVKPISKVVGGCTLVPMKGAWGVDFEKGLQLQVKCEIHKEQALEQAIKKGLDKVNEMGLNIDWCCGTKETVNGFNFSMKENGQ